MLKTSVISNTWACDCCALETNALVNPYFQITIQNNGSVISYSGEIDICTTCLQTITLQPIIDYIAKVNALA